MRWVALSVCVAVLVLAGGFALCSGESLQAMSFESNGDLIHGWYWLRDPGLGHRAWWTFEGVPPGEEDVILEITCLATDRAGGRGGVSATFRLAYGFPGAGTMGGAFMTQEVTLPNVSPPGDPLGYTCRGTVTIPRSTPGLATGRLTVFAERISPSGPHIAFNGESIAVQVPDPEVVVLKGYLFKLRQFWCTRSEGPLYVLQTGNLTPRLEALYILEYGERAPWQDDPLLEVFVHSDIEVRGTLLPVEPDSLPVLAVEEITLTNMFQRCDP